MWICFALKSFKNYFKTLKNQQIEFLTDLATLNAEHFLP